MCCPSFSRPLPQLLDACVSMVHLGAREAMATTVREAKAAEDALRAAGEMIYRSAGPGFMCPCDCSAQEVQNDSAEEDRREKEARDRAHRDRAGRPDGGSSSGVGSAGMTAFDRPAGAASQSSSVGMRAAAATPSKQVSNSEVQTD